jgi:hypothetical protein
MKHDRVSKRLLVFYLGEEHRYQGLWDELDFFTMAEQVQNLPIRSLTLICSNEQNSIPLD